MRAFAPRATAARSRLLGTLMNLDGATALPRLEAAVELSRREESITERMRWMDQAELAIADIRSRGLEVDRDHAELVAETTYFQTSMRLAAAWPGEEERSCPAMSLDEGVAAADSFVARNEPAFPPAWSLRWSLVVGARYGLFVGHLIEAVSSCTSGTIDLQRRQAQLHDLEVMAFERLVHAINISRGRGVTHESIAAAPAEARILRDMLGAGAASALTFDVDLNDPAHRRALHPFIASLVSSR